MIDVMDDANLFIMSVLIRILSIYNMMDVTVFN